MVPQDKRVRVAVSGDVTKAVGEVLGGRLEPWGELSRRGPLLDRTASGLSSPAHGHFQPLPCQLGDLGSCFTSRTVIVSTNQDPGGPRLSDPIPVAAPLCRCVSSG